MSSTLKINFWDRHFIDFRRLDPMQPMDLGDGPELLEVNIQIPRDAPETAWDPLFGDQTTYTGHLSDGSSSRPVFIKWARSDLRMEELGWEGDFYCSTLRKLQGVVVPNFYGYYASTSRNLLGLGCMILEMMDGGGIKNNEIDHRSKLEAAYRLHKAGIRHCELDSQANFLMHGGKVFIVGFSKATPRCGCEMTRYRVRLCPEMMQMERQLGDGRTNTVLEEIGVPHGWRTCLTEATGTPGDKPHEMATRRYALHPRNR